MVQVLREGYCIPFVGQLTLSVPISLQELFTQLRERKSFGGGGPDSSQEGSDRVGTSQSGGFTAVFL